MLEMLKLKEYFTSEGILISFNGSFTHGIIEEIGNAIKGHLESEQSKKGVITDVFAVYIEQTQNVRNYLMRKGLASEPKGSAILVIAHSANRYTIRSGNTMKKQDVPALAARLDQLQKVSKEELKTMYKEQLRKERGPDSTGAGLGLIDIARRTSGGLHYQFDPMDADHDFFSLAVDVERT